MYMNVQLLTSVHLTPALYNGNIQYCVRTRQPNLAPLFEYQRQMRWRERNPALHRTQPLSRCTRALSRDNGKRLWVQFDFVSHDDGCENADCLDFGEPTEAEIAKLDIRHACYTITERGSPSSETRSRANRERNERVLVPISTHEPLRVEIIWVFPITGFT